mgnify:CR=1 FL=1
MKPGHEISDDDMEEYHVYLNADKEAYHAEMISDLK